MKPRWKLGNLFGIDICLHWSFLLVPAWVLFSALAAGAGLAAGIWSVLFVMAIFGCVVLHELGHALMARRYDIATRDIILLPIGGVARLERMPDRPLEELAVALAGPLVNVVIAAALYIGTVLSGGAASLPSADLPGSSFFVSLMWANIVLVLFNLLPAFPMDGGRVLRALLAMCLPYERATTVAARVGQGAAVMFAVMGLFGNWMLLLVALFVYVAAGSEQRAAAARSSLRGFHVRDAMQKRFQVLRADTSVRDALEPLFASGQDDFPVLSGPYYVGMVSRSAILDAVKGGDPQRSVAELMRPTVTSVEEGSPLAQAVTRMQSSPHGSLPVTRAGQLVGVLTLENLKRWLRLQAVRRQPACDSAAA